MITPTHSGFDLIIFDCEGVLVDSERVANQVFAEILKEVCGLEFSLADMFEYFVGHSMAQCLEIVETLTGCPTPAPLPIFPAVQKFQGLANSGSFLASRL